MEPSWREWWSMDEAARAVVRDQLLERVPSGYVDPRAVGHRQAGLPQLIHRETGVLFHVVFGGPCVIGMSHARFDRLRRLPLDDGEDLVVPVIDREEAAGLQPAREVSMPTCLVADEPLAWGQLVKLGLDESKLGISGFSPVLVGALLRGVTRLGWRAPSEAEWEYACRCVEDTPGNVDLRVQGTGLLLGTGLARMGRFVELCSDDWHDTYEGAPTSPDWGRGHDVLRGQGPGDRFGGWLNSAAWSEAIWPGRRRLATWNRGVSFRPWLSLPQ